MTAAESVFEAVGAITFGPAQTFRNLTLVPLVADEPRAADYAVLDEALALGTVQIGETSEAGRVPELKVLNHGDKAVFLLDGEELIGAKQNRVLNLSILVPPHSESTIPVSCVESGPLVPPLGALRFGAASALCRGQVRKDATSDRVPARHRHRAVPISGRCGPVSKRRCGALAPVPRRQRWQRCTKTCSSRSRTFVSAFQPMGGQVGGDVPGQRPRGRHRALRRAGDVAEALIETDTELRARRHRPQERRGGARRTSAG